MREPPRGAVRERVALVEDRVQHAMFPCML